MLSLFHRHISYIDHMMSFIIIADKARTGPAYSTRELHMMTKVDVYRHTLTYAGEIYKLWCRYSERLRAEAGGGESLTHNGEWDI
jgi:hypothetical protein